MFGLSMREKIMQVIVNSCVNNADAYLQSVQSAIMFNPQVEEIALEACRNIYFDACSTSSLEIFKNIQSSAYARITLALGAPHVCGYDGMTTEPLSAGGTFAIVYWAIMDKRAQTKDCMALSHMQNDIMMDVLAKLDGQQ